MEKQNNGKDVDPKIKELNLLLLYLSGWEEDSRNNPGEKVFRSWKYSFDVLNALENDQFIQQTHIGKSVVLTETGRNEAEKIRQRILP